MADSKYLNVVGTGNSLEWLKQVPSDSVDSCVTDPPYGLGEPPPVGAVVMAWARGKDYKPEGTGFMGHEWDAFVPNPSLWVEVMRILKPGAYLLAFYGSRTYDLGSLSIRFAGFEIVDSMMWLYGKGWPKGLDIAKAIDKESGHWRGRAGGIVSENRALSAANYERTDKGHAITDAAKLWEGWNTQLKPAFEPIVVARKPFTGTYVENVLKHGTGAINIDSCRVGGDGGRYPANVLLSHDPRCVKKGTKRVKTGTAVQRNGGGQTPFSGLTGRKTPSQANPDTGYADEDGREDVDDYECVPGCPARILDEQSGYSKSPPVGSTCNAASKSSWRKTGDDEKSNGYGDEGGSSRFFYTAKAATKERWSYCRACKVVFQHADEEFEEHDAHKDEAVSHPTQKPLDLMRYFVRLVTPPGGTVVDPFAGTGTTAAAAKEQGFNFITADLDPCYAKIASARVATIHLGAGARVGASYFCPGCKAKGEIKLIEKAVVDRMKADGKKVTCSKCMKRYSYEELVSG